MEDERYGNAGDDVDTHARVDMRRLGRNDASTQLATHHGVETKGHRSITLGKIDPHSIRTRSVNGTVTDVADA